MKPLIVFQSDFTYKEGAVASVYGVIKSVDRELEIIDATQELPQYDIYSAGYRLFQYMKFYPKGTIFLSVVDPGVGTARKACVAKLEDYYIVTPDNGTLTFIKEHYPVLEVREIDETINRLRGKDTNEVAIFHGRDLFGYTAARLASGIISYEQVGPSYPVEDIVMLPILKPTIEGDTIKGIVEISDPNFGNSWTNIPVKMFKDAGIDYGDQLKTVITFEGKEILNQIVPFHKAFGDVAKGQEVIYHNELNNVALAVCMGSFMDRHKVGFGTGWQISFGKVKQ